MPGMNRIVWGKERRAGRQQLFKSIEFWTGIVGVRDCCIQAMSTVTKLKHKKTYTHTRTHLPPNKWDRNEKRRKNENYNGIHRSYEYVRVDFSLFRRDFEGSKQLWNCLNENLVKYRQASKSNGKQIKRETEWQRVERESNILWKKIQAWMDWRIRC